MSVPALLQALHEAADPAFAKKMQHFGIRHDVPAFGVRMPVLRAMAKPYRRQHELALALWAEPYHEAKILATLVEDYAQVTRAQADHWSAELYSWDVCDQWCSNGLYQTELAPQLIEAYAASEAEFVRRVAFVLIAVRAVKAKKVPDGDFLPYLELLQQYAFDERIYVKKAISWALRSIGKRRPNLLEYVWALVEILAESDHAAARWIATDARRDLLKHAARTDNK